MLKRSFTSAKKLQLLKEAQETSIPRVSLKYSIDKSMLYKWRKRIVTLSKPFNKLKRSIGSGRKSKYPVEETLLNEFINDYANRDF